MRASLTSKCKMPTLEGVELESTTLEDVQGDRTSALSEPNSDIHENGMTRSQALNLYTSHFFSTWNIRTYVSFYIGLAP